jgi:hypothetical protein
VANSNFNSPICDNLINAGGASFRDFKSHNYQSGDLIGGAFFEDTDGFIQISRNPI